MGEIWELCLDELYMSGYVQSASRKMEAEICTLRQRVTKEDTRERPSIKFMLGIRAQPWKAETAEDSKLEIVGRFVEKLQIW